MNMCSERCKEKHSKSFSNYNMAKDHHTKRNVNVLKIRNHRFPWRLKTKGRKENEENER